MSDLQGPKVSNTPKNKAGGLIGLPLVDPRTPQLDPVRAEQASRLGGAGRMLHNVLLRSKSAGMKP